MRRVRQRKKKLGEKREVGVEEKRLAEGRRTRGEIFGG